MIGMVAGWRGRVKLRLCAEKAVPNRCAFIGFTEFHRTPICESRINNQSSRSGRKSRGLFFRQRIGSIHWLDHGRENIGCFQDRTRPVGRPGAYWAYYGTGQRDYGTTSTAEEIPNTKLQIPSSNLGGLIFDEATSRSANSLSRVRSVVLPQRFSGGSSDFVRLSTHRSSGVRPVRRAIRASIRGPISSPSWKANA